MLKKWVEKLKQALSGSKTQGFTLIEIVIVLAIAGLIFVIVFLAVSQAQAARRDTQRKSDANKFVAAVNQYAGNNAGNIPSKQADIGTANKDCSQGQATFCKAYLDSSTSTFSDPDGNPYFLDYVTTAPAQDHMSYQNGNVCNGNAMTTTGANTRNFAILYFQERGGTVCVDNS